MKIQKKQATKRTILYYIASTRSAYKTDLSDMTLFDALDVLIGRGGK